MQTFQQYPPQQVKAMTVAELITPGQVRRPVSAPASLNSSAYQGFRASDHPMLTGHFVAHHPAIQNPPSRTINVTGCTHLYKCQMYGLDLIPTQFRIDGSRALDRLTEMIMVSHFYAYTPYHTQANIVSRSTGTGRDYARTCRQVLYHLPHAP